MPTRKSTSKSKSTKKTATKPTAKKKKASPKKKAPAKRKRAKKAVADEEVTIDRRRKNDRRDETSDETAQTAPKIEKRQKVARRRQIDPTTCERDYSDQEVEFMNALDEYKRKSGRMFPTCSEVLEVIRDLGYTQLTPTEQLALGRDDSATEESTSWQDSQPEDAEAELVG